MNFLSSGKVGQEGEHCKLNYLIVTRYLDLLTHFSLALSSNKLQTAMHYNKGAQNKESSTYHNIGKNRLN